jgi:transposase
VYHYFRTWKNTGVWGRVQGAIYEQARAQAGRSECPSVVIMDGQSVKTTERGGVRGFDAHKRVKGRKRHILVDTRTGKRVMKKASRLIRRMGVRFRLAPASASVFQREGVPRLINGRQISRRTTQWSGYSRRCSLTSVRR